MFVASGVHVPKTSDKASVKGTVTKIDAESNPQELSVHVKKSEPINVSSTVSPSANAGPSSGASDHRVVLRGVWRQTKIQVGFIVQVVDGKLLKDGDCVKTVIVVDNEAGFFVIQPDDLINTTSVTGSLYCLRKAWLSERFGGWGSSSEIMVIGSLVHEIFQLALSNKTSSMADLVSIGSSILQNIDTLNACYDMSLTTTDLTHRITDYYPHILLWMQNFLLAKVPTHPVNKDQSSKIKMCVTDIRDIEENVWVPKFGLKGKVDATLVASISDESKSTGRVFKTCFLPLELKTGRPSGGRSAHEGQVALYSLMLADRYGTEEGLLVYLKDGPVNFRVPVSHSMKRDLVGRRNELAYYRSAMLDDLPPLLDSRRTCESCEQNFACGLMAKSFPRGTKRPEGDVGRELLDNDAFTWLETHDIYNALTQHLGETDWAFFHHWVSLLHQESLYGSSRSVSGPKDFWNTTSDEAESAGTGIGHLMIHTYNDETSLLILRRAAPVEGSIANPLPSSSDIKAWERVSVSIDSANPDSQVDDKIRAANIALTLGYIKTINEEEIQVFVDNQLHADHKDALFRVDTLQRTSLFNTYFTNLLRLMSPLHVDARAVRLRDLIVSRRQPAYKKGLSKSILNGKAILRELNEPQQRAVLKMLAAEDYALITGTPGSGKTETIVAFVRFCVLMGHSVLITSATHSAVDNILLKLDKEHSLDFLRLGATNRIHPDLTRFSLSARTKSIRSVAELTRFYDTIGVVASTCLGVASHPIFVKRTFDYVIVDEASQVLLPSCLGPLFCGRKFLLVGDHAQLPPVVQNEKAKKGGLDVSLFAYLHNTHVSTQLNVQYRMNETIMKLANVLTYKNSLTCGSEIIARNTLPKIPNEELNLKVKQDWLRSALSSNLSRSVVLLDTDELSYMEVQDGRGRGYVNEVEADIAAALIAGLTQALNVSLSEIGLISFYRRQVALLKRRVRDPFGQMLEVNTVDQFQGRDKEVVIISSVRARTEETQVQNSAPDHAGDDSKFNDADILNDERRLNVALTRAKRKLILIGSVARLRTFRPFAAFIDALTAEQIITLPSSSFF